MNDIKAYKNLSDEDMIDKDKYLPIEVDDKTFFVKTSDALDSQLKNIRQNRKSVVNSLRKDAVNHQYHVEYLIEQNEQAKSSWLSQIKELDDFLENKEYDSKIDALKSNNIKILSILIESNKLLANQLEMTLSFKEKLKRHKRLTDKELNLLYFNYYKADEALSMKYNSYRDEVNELIQKYYDDSVYAEEKMKNYAEEIDCDEDLFDI